MFFKGFLRFSFFFSKMFPGFCFSVFCIFLRVFLSFFFFSKMFPGFCFSGFCMFFLRVF